MSKRAIMAVMLLLASPLLALAQTPASCEEQLGQAINTLTFARASRQQIEESAGHVTATLQKQIEALDRELAALKKAVPPTEK